MKGESKAIAVAQIGARMHYAVPRILSAAGMLYKLFTDSCSNRGIGRVCRLFPGRVIPPSMRRLGGRHARGVPTSSIKTFDLFSLKYAMRKALDRRKGDLEAAYVWSAREFCNRVTSTGLSGATDVYAFNGAALEIFQFARAKGIRTVLEQTSAPKRVELEISRGVLENYESNARRENAESMMQLAHREEAEWRLADLVLCPSEFVLEGVAKTGGPTARCKLVPYGVETADFARMSGRREFCPPLRVLTVGRVSILKGSPWLIDAASLMEGVASFKMVGSVDLPPSVLRRIPDNVSLVGPVPRSEIPSYYHWADVFVFPSLTEGSATVTYEALAAGLPVVCTSSSGSIIRDGVEGFIVPPRNAEAIRAKLMLLLQQPLVLQELESNVTSRTAEASLKAYENRLLTALNSAYSL